MLFKNLINWFKIILTNTLINRFKLNGVIYIDKSIAIMLFLIFIPIRKVLIYNIMKN